MKRLNFRLALLVTCCVLVTLGAVSPSNGGVNVTQHHNHLSRDGLYVDPAFTAALAAGLQRDLAFDGRIIGSVFAQPLYIEGGPRGRAVVIAVTESNYVFALDAVSGSVIWQTNVAPPVTSGLPCGDISPYGITGTPVVDLPSRTLFFDAVTKDSGSGTVKHLIYSMNVDTGNITHGWPVDVNTYAKFGTTNFSSLAQGERGALAVIGTNLYVPYGGLDGDCGTYYGWVVGVPMNNPTDVVAWATQARGGGIWAVGGVASDGTDPFVATGNTFSANTWAGGEAVIHFQPSLVLTNGTTNYWVPSNWMSLDSGDLDLGGSGPVLVDVPGATPSKLVVALGKDGNVYLLNRTNLGGVSAPVAQAHVSNGSIIQAAATYQTTQGTYVVFLNGSSLTALRIGASNPPTITNVWTSNAGGRGSPFVTSTDGTNNVIVWGVGCEGDQRLHGFDGDTGTNIFTGGGANELMAGTRRWNTGIAARGRIYVAGDNKVYAFSLPGLTVTITSPANGANLTNPAVTVKGTANDNVEVTSVWYQFNGEGWTNAAGTTNWTANVVASPGLNTINVYAVDSSGNISPTNSVSFTYTIVSAPLVVRISGNGTVTPNYNGHILQIGKSYSMTAKPGAGSVFSNWTGSVVASAPHLAFTMQIDTALQANFVPNPFIPATGTYAGLFYDTNTDAGVTVSNAGFFTATVNNNGGFTGSLHQGAKRYPLSGQFSLTGAWSTNFIKGAGDLSASLQLELNGGKIISGHVNGGGWAAELRANLNLKTNGTSPAGNYTFIMPAGINGPAGSPGGYGFGTLKLTSSGVIALSGTLGDGTKIAQRTFVSQTGILPFYALLYSGQGLILGWLMFTNDTVNSNDLEGVVSWNKPGQAPGTKIYTNGFAFGLTNGIEVPGSYWTNRTPLLNWSNGVVFLSNAIPAESISNPVTLSPDGKVADQALTNELTLTITTASGLFKGSVTETNGAKQTIKFGGAIHQKSNAGYGLFIGTNQTGGVFLGRLH